MICMGWTGYHINVARAEQINRKAECDALFNPAHGFVVMKSAMVGAVYYAAIKRTCKCVAWEPKYIVEPLAPEDQYVYGVVVLTQVDMKSYENFWYKDIDEGMGPSEDNCPASILKLLTPTDKEYAIDWRKRCWENIEKKKKAKSDSTSLTNLPIGTKIQITYGGKEYVLEKMSPNRQFKRPWWYIPESNQYMSIKRIPSNYTVLA